MRSKKNRVILLWLIRPKLKGISSETILWVQGVGWYNNGPSENLLSYCQWPGIYLV